MNADKTIEDRKDKRDNLKLITGIGPGYERDLHQIDVLTFAQLVEFKDAQYLHKALEKSGIEIPLWKIKKQDWIGQATEKLKNQKKVQNAKESNDSTQNQNQDKSNNEHAAFIVSFDHHTSEDGEESWSTVVSYAEPDEFLMDFSIPYRKNPSTWLKRIFTNAIESDKIDTPDTELVVPRSPITEDGNQLRIVNVQVEVPSATVHRRELMVRVQFELPDTMVETWTEDKRFYRLELYLFDLEGQVTELAASTQRRLEPGILADGIKEPIPIPSPGRYKLYILLFSLPPTGTIVTHLGPTINVVPHPVSAQ